MHRPPIETLAMPQERRRAGLLDRSARSLRLRSPAVHAPHPTMFCFQMVYNRTRRCLCFSWIMTMTAPLILFRIFLAPPQEVFKQST
jgi:hypothetical protein